MDREQKPPLVVICGPTSSGKSALGVKLAKKFKGEIVSADSRQIYKRLDIGTGKIGNREMGGVSHHLLSIASPGSLFSAERYKKAAGKAIKQIRERGHTPFLVGGTGFYIDAVARGIEYPKVAPDHKLRSRLSQKSLEELLGELRSLDPKTARRIDKKNPQRLIRAIEIIKKTGRPIHAIKSVPKYRTLFIGIKKSDDELKRSIRRAVRRRIRRGLIRETKEMLLKLPESVLRKRGTDYGPAIDTLRHNLPKSALARKLERQNWQYARRQKTWFRRYHDIHYVRDTKEASRLISHFIQLPTKSTSQKSKNAVPKRGARH